MKGSFSRAMATLIVFAAACGKRKPPPFDPAPLTAGVEIVYYRNSDSPPATVFTLYFHPPKELRQGKGAYALKPPEAWRQFIAKVQPGQEKNDFPVAFAAMRKFPNGKRCLMAGQLKVKFSGDGFSSPGPEVHCEVFTIDVSDPDHPALLWKGDHSLGAQQNSQLHAATADPVEDGSLTMLSELRRPEGGEVFTHHYTFTPADNYSVKMESK